MENIEKLVFTALDVNGSNYMRWIINVKTYLKSQGLLDTINEDNNCSEQDKAKSIFFLRKHIEENLNDEYINEEDPCILWKDLQERFDHQKEILLPRATDEWNKLRFQDFKKVNDYNSALFRISAQLRFAGKEITDRDMLEKTFTTFHASNITLQQTYRMQNFTRYSQLNTVLLVAEQNCELLMKNHESRPTGSAAFPEANAVTKNDPKGNTYGRGRGRGRGRGQGKGRGRFNQNHNYNYNHSYGHNYNSGKNHFRNFGRGRGYNNTPREKKFQPPKNNEANTSKGPEDPCFRCGIIGHWSRTCRTASHLCKLYQESLKGKQKEANFTDLPNDPTPELNASDFFDDLSD